MQNVSSWIDRLFLVARALYDSVLFTGRSPELLVVLIAVAVLATGLRRYIAEAVLAPEGRRRARGALQDDTLEARVERSARTLASAARVVDDLKAELDQKSGQLFAMREEVSRLRQAASVSKEEAEALAATMGLDKGSRRRAFLWSLLINFLFLIAGAVLGKWADFLVPS